ncbi:hypothetical protein GCM10023307_09530 [Lysobacter hankyongensis]|uniref:Uncharacterized protein n=1 Tax=Lysobacter hankyongensis TaxID=1176535 RepID=A0ABP9AV68_9GAMM
MCFRHPRRHGLLSRRYLLASADMRPGMTVPEAGPAKTRKGDARSASGSAADRPVSGIASSSGANKEVAAPLRASAWTVHGVQTGRSRDLGFLRAKIRSAPKPAIARRLPNRHTPRKEF